MSVLKVSLSSTVKPLQRESGQPVLSPQGPLAIVGGERVTDGIPEPIRPEPRSLFGPRGGCIAPDGSLWICDTGHHRLLGWSHYLLAADHDAEWWVGQQTLFEEGRNARKSVGSNTLSVPTGITPYGQGLVVADAWNNRVLGWDTLPRSLNQPADWVLGQPDFESGMPNQGKSEASASSMHWPFGVLADGETLWVADSKNRRVLRWNQRPTTPGAPADFVLGQPDFDTSDENRGSTPDRASMRWPHALTLWGGKLCLADAGNNRVLIWDGVPERSLEPCSWILGQPDGQSVDHNQSSYWPRPDTLNMPYALWGWKDWLLVADTANSRLLGWHSQDLADGAPARGLTGQADLFSKGDNRWGEVTPDSLCWPYGLGLYEQTVLVADSGNNRVHLWNLDEGL
ncbi:MAG: hypothetical protein ACO4AU_06815 [bacterium]